ncbi:glycosyltransferase [Microbacterium sp. SLBN-146]|uniref:glycosyltransferase n=1 Tax=Microbacterium sp. SLBN-146 TaxID=2768457 RepID=UPI00115307D7|nr:glycosyltransferase [Microbacterium sp. SLBN-146]TQJ30615.1 glycosyltransferase involved in cell wall biosynthesis [Microbacterium sp. SLBN-146]
MIGTRGVPAAYGGFETAVEEVGKRLAERGHDVVVYTRGAEDRRSEYLGMRIVHLPAVPQKQLETLSHTAVSALHAVGRDRPDVAFVFNAANSPFLPLLRWRGIPVALHMDGLEWRRSKWGPRGRAYYRWAEQQGVRTADALIADAPGIADYYLHQFDAPTELIRYGAPLIDDVPHDPIRAWDLEPGGYHLVVARFEPENHVLEIVQGFHESGSRRKLVVVGAAPYSAEYTQAVHAVASADDRIVMLGRVDDQAALDALYAHAHTYIHGHSVGGTNPSLLRAMGARTAVIAYDVEFNREVLDGHAWLFGNTRELARCIESVEQNGESVRRMSDEVRERAASAFRWDDVADQYEDLAHRLDAGYSVHGAVRSARRAGVEWRF